MGKKRIIKTSGSAEELKSRGATTLAKKRVAEGILYIQATYNNTIISLTDNVGNVLAWSTAGALGFKGTRKSTPYAASKVAELLAEHAKTVKMQKVGIIVRGIGAGRESAIRSFAAKGFDIPYIKDMTPLPHNGPKPPKPRRV